MDDYQDAVDDWCIECFGGEIAYDTAERNHRFAEEAMELVQALGCTREDVLALVDYVYGRPAGVPHQEVGGVMTTLAALCNANGLDMGKGAWDELARITQPANIEKIRRKQATKPKGALPQ